MRSRHAITRQFHLFEFQDRVFAQANLGQEFFRVIKHGKYSRYNKAAK